MIPKTLQALLHNLYNKLIWLLAKSPPIFRMSVIYIHNFLYIILGETSMVTIHWHTKLSSKMCTPCTKSLQKASRFNIRNWILTPMEKWSGFTSLESGGKTKKGIKLVQRAWELSLENCTCLYHEQWYRSEVGLLLWVQIQARSPNSRVVAATAPRLPLPFQNNFFPPHLPALSTD